MLLPLAVSGLLSLLCLVQLSSASPNCFDDDGNPVDWYIVYKFPVIKKSSYPFNTGYAYAFMTSDDIGLKRRSNSRKRVKMDGNEGQWRISNKLITDPDSMVLKTLSVAYDPRLNTINSVFYNDHPPTPEDEQQGMSKNSRRAHAKGVVLVDESNGDGLWLSHSTPQFPPHRNERLEYADNSRVPAQSFICLNFDLNQAGPQIFRHLINMRPQVYESFLSPALVSWMPDLTSLEPDGFKGKRYDGDEQNLAQLIKTRGGQELGLFSKSATFNEDLFSGWLDHALGSSLFVQTWRNGVGGHLDSTCPRNQPRTNNVKEMKVTTDEGVINWTYRQDHSKWAISESQDAGFVCISDINRAASQFSRGGGAICIKCPKCWNIFSKSILELEPCPVGY